MSRLAKAWNSTEKIKHGDGMAQKHMATSSKAKERQRGDRNGKAKEWRGIEERSRELQRNGDVTSRQAREWRGIATTGEGKTILYFILERI